MEKNLTKKILKALANAPTITAEKLLNELQTEEEKQHARRIFAAVGISTQNDKKTK